MKKQKGFAHLQLVLLVIVVMSVISFAAYRVGQSQSNKNKATETTDIDTVQEIKTVESEKQEEVVIPEEEKEVEPAPVKKTETAPTTTEKKTTEPVTEEKKKSDKRWLKMTKVSAVQSGSTITTASTLPEPLTGTCSYKLWQDGYEKVYSSVSITNSTDCTGQLDVSNLPTYSGWSLHAWFDSSDGTVSASQAEEPITIVE